ncbi:hypothetical protein FHP26_14700, partial [Pseudomonas orientalis]|nr:hypothetical protein [Pseudomonas orientalis]
MSVSVSVTEPPPSGASPLPHFVRGCLDNSVAPTANHDAQRVALDLALDLDLRRPVKPRWPNAG